MKKNNFIHITEFREKHPDLVPDCIIDGCTKKGQFMGSYDNHTGHPKFRKYCIGHHNKRRKVFQDKIGNLTKHDMPICIAPGCSANTTIMGTDENGDLKFSRTCKTHGFSSPYLIHRKDYCENVDGRLGFTCTTTILDARWQLEVDHIDEDHFHNDESNLQTLCACCHRIKTKMYRTHDHDGLNSMREMIDFARSLVLSEKNVA